MWPFRASTRSTAISGLITCDGKHHTWSCWKQYEETGMVFGLFIKGGVPYSESKQWRKCQICGFLEVRKIKEE